MQVLGADPRPGTEMASKRNSGRREAGSDVIFVAEGDS